MDRREFLSSGAAGTAIVLTSAASARHGAQWLRGTPPVRGLNRATFEQWLQSSFELRRLGTMHSSHAQLVAVRDGVQTPGLEQFHVILRGDGPQVDGRYELRHQDGTELQLWLDPAGLDGGAALMRATFSLITPV